MLACYSARADLVVIGRHSGPGTGPAVASVQHSLLNHARGPVAIVPLRGDHPLWIASALLKIRGGPSEGGCSTPPDGRGPGGPQDR